MQVTINSINQKIDNLRWVELKVDTQNISNID